MAAQRAGLVGGRAYDVRESQVKDLPMGRRLVQVVWRKRRYRGQEPRCPQRVFTERSLQVLPRHRLTARLRTRLKRAASRSARALSDVAAEYNVSWWSAGRCRARARAARAAAGRLGLDKTRARSMRWLWQDDVGWRLSNPWLTSFVDFGTGRPGWLLGLVPGCSGAAVETWLATQPQAWRNGIEVVALDPSAPFAAAIRRLHAGDRFGRHNLAWLTHLRQR